MPPLELARHLVMFLPRRLWLSRTIKNTANVDLSQQEVVVILSSDTEFDPPSRERTWRGRSTAGLLDGLPRLLEICDRYKAPATFFCEGRLVEELPEFFKELAKRHEVGCHSYAHEWLGAGPPPRWIPRRDEFSFLSSEAKAEVLRRGAGSIERAVGKRPRSFKAPFNSIDHPSTLRLLEQIGFEADSSLPSYNNATFSHPLSPTPTRHTSSTGLWREGKMKLIEVPFMIRPRPLLLHPFDVREEIADTVARGMKLAIESVDIQCRIDAISGRDLSLVHITSHPWEFCQVGQRATSGRANAENLTKFLEEITALHEVKFMTVTDFVARWEDQLCPIHSCKSENTESSN